MRWLKRDVWKAGIAFASMLFLLVLMVWVPVSAAGAGEGTLGLAATATGTVQATLTEDATVSALNKEKLAQEVQQLKNQNAPDLFGWFRTNAAILLSTLVVVIGGLIGLFRWFGDRRSEREKRAEERFQATVTGLGDEKEGATIGAAILLRTFLRPGYKQFYIQTFDLAVAYLRLPRTPLPSKDTNTGTPNSPEDSNTPLPLTTLSRALIVVFKEAFPLARKRIKKRRLSGLRDLLQRITERPSFPGYLQRPPQSKDPPDPDSYLNAAGIQLDNAYLVRADLNHVWMPEASLRQADLREAKLIEAKLGGAKLIEANLAGAELRKANLTGANLAGAELREANLTGANLGFATLVRADLSVANPEDALFLSVAHLGGVVGLTKEQLAACKAKGAIIDEDSTTGPPQSPVSPSSPSQSDNVQALPTPATGGSSAASSESGSQS